MKQVALGRKNWLFIGSVAAGTRAADLFTLVSSAVRNDLDVWTYVKDVLDQLLAGNCSPAAPTMPHYVRTAGHKPTPSPSAPTASKSAETAPTPNASAEPVAA